MQWLQMSSALMLLAALVPPRIDILRPHARRIALAALAIYVTFATAIVILRIVVGPGLFMD
jgi:hypothetical protein